MNDNDRSNAATSPEPDGQRLESWKEIAAHLGRDVRTVQRWQRREGLPVHRLHHNKLGSVYAYAVELDAWRTRHEPTETPAQTTEPEPTAAAKKFRPAMRVVVAAGVLLAALSGFAVWWYSRAVST